ncbi:MAG: hypothetical protein [Enterobacter phage ENC7]|nr:MAG: hypothetical protein [Enterobacter phage ENC7]UIW11912.1 MAG: hypothetical protein [Enterobacter phage ENC25]UIW12170.1 MAG: hypothetical protein [Enterobacter phage ENC22]URP85765.1 hypothetical protein ECW2_0087 [Enterobacter phage EC-W2]
MHHVKVSIKDITVGDTVIHEGKMKTVGKKDIKRDPLFGVLLFGDSFNLGRTFIERVVFPKWYQGKRVDVCLNS